VDIRDPKPYSVDVFPTFWYIFHMCKEFLEKMHEILTGKGFVVPKESELVSVNEAYVYRVELEDRSLAYKLYPENFTFGDIKEYQRLTNGLARKINNTSGTIQTLDGSIQFDFFWQVVSIDKIIDVNGVPCTISEFIDGPNMYDIVYSPSNLNNQHALELIETAQSQSVDKSLEGFSDDFNGLMESSAILLNITNVKTQSLNGNSVIKITDLCENVSRVKKRFKY